MKDIIKGLIKDFHKGSIPGSIERNLSVLVKSGKIISIIGSRRAGKTYFMYLVMNRLLKSVKKEDIIYINFEDERLSLTVEDMELIIESYYELYPNNKRPLYFFFDEIQNIANWEKFVRRVYDTISKNIFVTGSSSRLLSKEIATSLRGRVISYELFPLTFDEYLRFRKIDADDICSTRNKARIVRAFNDYLFEGGFPEVVNINTDLRMRILQSYLDVMIYRDIIDRYDIKNPTALKYIIKKSMSNISNYLSVNKLFNELKSSGVKAGKDSIYLFLNYIQDCYLLFLVNIYSESINVQNTNDKKIYCIDNGLANNVSFRFSQDKGRMLENAVHLHLRATGSPVFYYSDKRECDFVIQKKHKVVSAIQVTSELNSKNRVREIEGLQEALNYFRLKQGTIITLDQSETFRVDGKDIMVLPVWKWILENLH